MGFIPVYCAYLTVDCAQVSITGVLRGLGKQVVGAIINAGTLDVIGITAVFYLARSLQGVGALIGLAAASLCALVGMWGAVLKTNWLLEVRKCMERVGGGPPKDVEEIQMSRLDKEEEPPEFDTSETVPLFSTKGPSAADTEARITITVSLCTVVTMVIALTLFFVAL